MKKLFLFLFLTVCLSACSGDDNANGSGNSGNNLNPPAWIQGTWQMESAMGTAQIGFRFTSNDVCNMNSTMFTCYKEMIDHLNRSQLYANVTEEISDTKYYVEITNINTTNSYQFEKISANRIKWVNAAFNSQSFELVRL